MADRIPYCSGALDLQRASAECSIDWQFVDLSTLQAGTSEPAFDISQLDPVELAGMYSTGFVLVGSVWLMGWAARELLALIKR